MNDCSTCNCGCNNGFSLFNNNGGSCSWIWIILLFSFFGNNGCSNGCGSLFNSNRCGDNCCGNNSCEWLIWILLISCFSGNGCGCGCSSCN